MKPCLPDSVPCRPLQNTLRLAALILALIPGLSNAAPPTLDALYPAGLRAGSSAQVTAVGKTEPWPLDLHCSNPNVSFKADPGKKGSFTATATAEAEPGPYIVRLANMEGTSEPMIFVVGTLPESTEALDNKGNENNDSNTTAQKVETLPLTINGRLTKSEDIDIYRMALKKGQTLVANLDAYGMRSPMDPYLHLYNPGGDQIALGNDNGTNLDPFLTHKIPRDGDYTIAVMAYAHPPGSDVRFTGKSSAVYRLTLTTGPWLSHTLPLAVKKTGATALKLFGYNLPDQKPHLPLDFTNTNPTIDRAIIRHPSFPNHLELPLTSTTPTLLAEQTEISVPAAVSGQLANPGETDQLTFAAKKGQPLDIRVASRRFGFPLDPVLAILNADGKELKRVDDGKVETDRDARLVWSAPEAGNYTLAISDLFRKGGSQWYYLLTVDETTPSFTATVEKSAYKVEAGKTLDVKIKINRLNGHKTPLKIEAKNLPHGISIEPPKTPEKTADVTVKIKADETTADATLPIQFALTETEGEAPASHLASYSFLPTIPGGPYLLNETADIWLAVKGKAKPKPAAKEPEKKEAAKETK
jgi:hypothetical protein